MSQNSRGLSLSFPPELSVNISFFLKMFIPALPQILSLVKMLASSHFSDYLHPYKILITF